MFKGTVKWFNNQKGYGFIQDESGKDIFVHYTGLNMPGFKSLEEGNEVEFDIVQGEKGPQASNVVKLQNCRNTKDSAVAGIDLQRLFLYNKEDMFGCKTIWHLL